MIRLRSVFLVCLILLPGVKGQDALAIVKQSLNSGAFFRESDPRYLYTQHHTESNLDGSGKAVVQKTDTSEILTLGGRRYEKLIARNGVALNAAQQAEELKKMNKVSAERESRQHDPAALERSNKEKQRREQIKAELPEAFHFELKGTEVIRGRTNYVIAASPRAEFHSSNRVTRKILPAMRGTIWVDQQTGHWTRIHADVEETIRYGLFLASVAKGSSIDKEDCFVNGEAWMPATLTIRYDARLGMVRHFHGEQAFRYDNYRKFDSSSQLISASEQ